MRIEPTHLISGANNVPEVAGKEFLSACLELFRCLCSSFTRLLCRPTQVRLLIFASPNFHQRSKFSSPRAEK